MYQHLISEQRYGIFSLLATNSSFSFIAKTLSVSVSTISREIKRNSWRKKYRPKEAQELADGRKKRLVNNHCIKKEVKKRILYYLTEEQWSPKQISGYLKKECINVSHEYIYQIIREDKKNGGTLYTHLRHKGNTGNDLSANARKYLIESAFMSALRKQTEHVWAISN